MVEISEQKAMLLVPESVVQDFSKSYYFKAIE